MCPAQSKYQVLLQWATKQKKWQQDALRRLVTAGSFENMSETDKKELLELIRDEANSEKSVGEPLQETDLPSSDVNEPKTYLKTLGPVSNVDRLASGQHPIKFTEPNGMTVIFGVNGSGKSGYARILKNLCRAVGNPPSLNGNFTIPEANRSDWEVNLTYSEDGTDKSLVWKKTDEETKPESLKRISVFDSKTANVYVEGERELHYSHLELRLLEGLNKAILCFNGEYDRQIAQLEGDIPALATIAAGTTAATLLSRLKVDIDSLPTSAEVEAETSFSEAHQFKLNDLLLLQAQTPQAKKQTLEGAKSYLETVKTQLDFGYSCLSEEKLNSIKALFEDWNSKRTVAAKGAAGLASDMPLPTIVVTDTWRELFIIARGIAIGVFPDADEPAIANGENCVLCQQSLDENAKQRLLTFNGIIEGELQKASEVAKNTYQDVIQPIQQSALETGDNVRQRLQSYAQLSSEHASRATLLAQITNGMQPRLAAVRKVISELSFGKKTELPLMPQNISDDIQTWLDEIDQELPLLDIAIANGDTGLPPAQLEELAKLEARKTLATNKESITKCLETLEKIRMLKKFKDLCKTEPITRQLGIRIDATVTDAMTATYKAELSKLKLDYITVKVGRRGVRGRQQIQSNSPELHEAKNKLGEVLSEGEQRALALAEFLTEVNESDSGHAIIFDDPVTSFDWERKTAIAERLIDEASNRQVVIFTHDFAFANMLNWECNKIGTTCGIQWINRLDHPKSVSFGVIGDEHAQWDLEKVTNAEIQIQSKIDEISSLNQNSTEYINGALLVGKKLRITWEKAIEEYAFNKVISRFTPEVKVTQLSRVNFNALDDFADFNKGFSRASKFEHAGTTESSSIPSTADLKENLEALKAWRESLTAKKPKDGEALTGTAP